MDPDAHARRDAIGGGADPLTERAVGGAELGIEHRHLDRSLGHRMTVEVCEPGGDIGRFDRLVEAEGRQKMVDRDVLGSLDVLGRVGGLGDGDALAPAVHAGAIGAAGGELDEQDVSLAFDTEAGAERADEWEPDAPERQRFDLDRWEGFVGHGSQRRGGCQLVRT